MPKHSSRIIELAKHGATVRFHELQAEISSLVKDFPHLRVHLGGRKPITVTAGAQFLGEASPVTPRRRKRKPMTAAQKKAVGARMKRYWATQRAEKAKKGNA